MSRRRGVLCAAALVLAAVGCVDRAFLAKRPAPPAYRQVVNGSPGDVSATLEQGLSEAGVSVLVKRLPGEVRLAGQTKSGQVFCLYVKKAGNEKSVVSIHWDRYPDDQFWRTVVDIVTAPADEEDSSPDEP